VLGEVTKEIDENEIATGFVTDLEKLTASRKTRDFLGGNGLMETTKTLGDGVLGRLVDGPEVPITILEVNSDVTADTNSVGVVRLLEKLSDTLVLKDGIGIHSNEMIDVVHLDLVLKPAGHGVEKLAREDGLRVLGTGVELVEERSNDNETVTLALVLVLDDAVEGQTLVEALGNLNVHLLAVPSSVSAKNLLPLSLVKEDILVEVIASGLCHARTTNTTIADDHDAFLVVLKAGLVDERVEGASALFECLVVTGNDVDHILGGLGLDLLLGADPVDEGEDGDGSDHDAVEDEGEGDEGEVDVVVSGPVPTGKDKHEAGT